MSMLVEVRELQRRALLTDRDILEDNMMCGMWRGCCGKRCNQRNVEEMKSSDEEEDGFYG